MHRTIRAHLGLALHHKQAVHQVLYNKLGVFSTLQVYHQQAVHKAWAVSHQKPRITKVAVLCCGLHCQTVPHLL